MKIIIGMEMQIPYEDPKSFNAFCDFVVDYSPDGIVMVGDFLDVPGPSRWNRGTAQEFEGSLQKECDTAQKYLHLLRSVYTGWIGYHTQANHEMRIQNYIRAKAPAFANLRGLTLSSLLDLKGFKIEELGVYSKFDGFTTTHGDKGSLSKYGGGTAISAARKIGTNVVCGHTHRHGVIYERFGQKNIFGLETGHMMNVKKASYVDHPNWSQGFGVVESTKSGVWPSVVTTRNGKYQFHGQ